MDTISLKEEIIKAGYRAVEQLIKVAKEEIISDEDDISADKLKNAAQAKKLAIFDAFEILNRIEIEKENLEAIKKGGNHIESRQGFAERRSR
jgi:ASC-1-like (ASCH) protein